MTPIHDPRPDESDITIDCTWKTRQTIEVPEGWTREEAIKAFNDGHFGSFEEFDASTAELTDWEAS